MQCKKVASGPTIDMESLAELDNDCLPISSFGPIHPHLQVPEALVSSLSKLDLNEMMWHTEIKRILENPLTKAEMIELLQIDMEEYTPNDAVMINLWFFRGVSACDGDPRFVTKLIEYPNFREHGIFELLSPTFDFYRILMNCYRFSYCSGWH